MCVFFFILTNTYKFIDINIIKELSIFVKIKT